MTASVRKTEERFPGSRKQQIVDAILELVAERGAEAVSAQLIADKIGVSQPAVFRHFATKEAMWLAVMDWLEEQLGKVFELAQRGTTRSPVAVLAQMFRGHVRLIERQPALAKLIISDGLRRDFPAIHDRFGDLHRNYWTHIVKVITAARSEGELAPETSAPVAATMFLALIQGLAFQFAIARQAMDLPRTANRVFDLYLRSLRDRAVE